jgi:hypothetical protein
MGYVHYVNDRQDVIFSQVRANPWLNWSRSTRTARRLRI